MLDRPFPGINELTYHQVTVDWTVDGKRVSVTIDVPGDHVGMESAQGRTEFRQGLIQPIVQWVEIGGDI